MKKLLTSLLGGVILLSSCNDSDWREEMPQTFKLTEVQFTSMDESLEKVVGEPRVTVFENRSDRVKTFKLTRTEYRKKTSLFYSPDNEYPLNNNIGEKLTSIPEIDAQPKFIGLSALKYPLVFDKLQTQTDSLASNTVQVSVSSNSCATYTSQWVGYRMKATYQLTLENEISGERITLTGKWEGMQEVMQIAELHEKAISLSPK